MVDGACVIVIYSISAYQHQIFQTQSYSKKDEMHTHSGREVFFMCDGVRCK
jgi:hypothetical protein